VLSDLLTTLPRWPEGQKVVKMLVLIFVKIFFPLNDDDQLRMKCGFYRAQCYKYFTAVIYERS